MSESYLDVANHSCGNFPSNVDEFIESGLTKAKCDLVAAPRVQEAAISFECQLDHVHPLWDQNGKPTTEVVLVRAVRIHVDSTVLIVDDDDDYDPLKPVIDTLKLKPVSRLGGNIYNTLGEQVDIPRPKVS